MNEFIEKNRSLLSSYRIGARITGWLLLIIALVIAVVKPLSGFDNNQFRFHMIYRLCQQTVVGYVLLALILLGLAQFVRYQFESEYQPGLILRHGDKVLYIYAIALIVSPIIDNYLRMKEIGYIGTVNLLMFTIAVILPAIAKALIFIGMAKVLKRMVPVIEESKTLV